MANNSAFENPFSDYSVEIASNILNSTSDSISDKFKTKLKRFQAEKFEVLSTTMRDGVFHDYSVYTGSAGVALMYYKYATRHNQVNHDFLMKCIDYLKLDQLKRKRISFLCGDAGPLAIATVVSYKLGSRRPDCLPEYKSILKRLTDLIVLLQDSPDELLYGRSGYLYALLFVNQQIGKEVVRSDHIEKVVQAILRSGKQLSAKMKSDSPLLWQWHDKVYLGAAHGMAGILYMLLQARQWVGPMELRAQVRSALDWLLGLRFPSGNFPSSLESSNGDRLVQWCHGAPGFVPLCLLAYKLFEEERYLKLAVQTGEVVWQRGLCTKGFSLCHGVAGNAYAFIQLYQATRKPVQLYRACCFAEWCALEREGAETHPPDRPASLFEGLAGRLCLAEDIMNIYRAQFPAFEL